MKRSIFIGYDRREEVEFAVARSSMLRHLSESISIHALELPELQRSGLYTRPTDFKDGRLIDVLSKREDYDGSISTDHANARFLVPHLAREGLALFCDSDVLSRADIARIFDDLDPGCAVHCVQHKYEPKPGLKMDRQIQTVYARKNWSSVMIFDCDHEANQALTLEMVNTLPGRDLHRFCWLDDSEIGGLDPAWNFLVGHSDPSIEPKLAHFTDGTPRMAGYANVPYAAEWTAEAVRACEQIAAKAVAPFLRGHAA